ncbi:MAG: hypothetical protein N2323_02525 [candidate division WOR-3 bacterium]|nr:hypothetical protein [candidate division WOR-3 bacterium]MCX7836822.1 hypothetical protein [candidate division WOR-3 bacterium]MDW8113860.1 hypothetical protein [candidate division WOR-3 bacterium]
MKKILVFLILSLVYPCVISFKPNTLKGKVGEIKTITIEVKNIHTPCLLTIDETYFEYENVKPVSISKWDTLKPNLFQKVISIKLLKEGKGNIKLKRSCPIQVSQGKVEILIEKREYKELKEEIRKLLKEIILGENINFEYLINTFDEFIKIYEKRKIKEDKNLYLLIKEIYNYLIKIKELSQREIE